METDTKMDGAWISAGLQIERGIMRDVERVIELFQVWEFAATYGVELRNVPTDITEAALTIDGTEYIDTVREWGPWLAEEGHLLFGKARP